MLWRETALVRLVGLASIPLVASCRPRVLQLDDDGCTVQLPLARRTRNHVGGLYFGALGVGADLAGGLNAMRAIRYEHPKVVLIFTAFQGKYMRRCDGPTVFRCRDGPAVREAVARADASGERVTLPVSVIATVPSRSGDEPTARFTLELSLRRRRER